MDELKPNTRIKFFEGKQTEFINEVCKKMNFKSLKKMADNKIDISYSSLKKYKREELLLPYCLVCKLCEISGYDPSNLKIKEYLPSNWGNIKGGKKGIKIVMKKYKKEMQIWRSKNKEYLKTLRLKKIKKSKLNEELAELLGICLGDGTTTKYFIRISGDKRYDGRYFLYITKIAQKLFGISTVMFKDKKKNTLYVQLSSKNLVEYLTNILDCHWGESSILTSISPLR